MIRTKRNRSSRFSYQGLEARRMLAGDVQAFVSDSVVTIIGDALANQIQLTTNDSGNVVVTGVNTTINGGTNFVVSGRFESISLFMEGGNDEVSLDGITAPRHFSFYGAAGNDRLTVASTATRYFHSEGGDGDDVYELGMRVQKSAYIYLGTGNNTIATTNLNVGRNLKIFGESGNDTFVSDSLRVNRKLEFNLAGGNDRVLMAGQTTVRNRAKIETGEGNDFVAITPETNNSTAVFRDSVHVSTGGGDDALVTDGSVTLRDHFRVDGGGGTDSLIANATTDDGSKVEGFETRNVVDLQTRLDAIFATLTAANIDPVPFGGTAVVEPVAVSLNTTSTDLTFTAGSDPTVVDDAIEVVGEADQTPTITAADVRIDNFVAEDLLAVVDTADITGRFNVNSGTLTLTGTGTLAEYQAVLRTVTFQNTSSTPDTAARQIQFTVTVDEQLIFGFRSLSMSAAQNIAPAITLDSAVRAVTTNDLPAVVDNLLTVADEDNTELAGASVAFTSGQVEAEDSLTFTQVTGITGAFDSTTGELTFTGSASLADYQTVLQSVTYANSAAAPTVGDRTLRFTVDDGTATSTAEVVLQLTAAALAQA